VGTGRQLEAILRKNNVPNAGTRLEPEIPPEGDVRLENSKPDRVALAQTRKMISRLCAGSSSQFSSTTFASITWKRPSKPPKD